MVCLRGDTSASDVTTHDRVAGEISDELGETPPGPQYVPNALACLAKAFLTL